MATLTEEQKKRLTAAAIGIAAAWVAYRFIPSPLVKTAAASVGAVIIARQLPIVGPALA